MILLLDNAVRIPPAAAQDFAAFRRWTKSKDFPQRGEYAFLGGDLWAGISMETLVHNQIKLRIAAVLSLMVVDPLKLGRVFSDRMRLVYEPVHLSCEPDAMFVSHASVDAGRVRWEEGRESLEVIGTPDMVLAVVSSNSIEKDTVVLRDLYAQTGIPEYWLVNPLEGQLSFDILRRSGRRYVATRKSAGWVKSAVFGKSFRLVEESGDDAPQYQLLVR
ncbi:MAG TPA: Uma2 family endonuclease [Pirellulaceae bacterium]|nr:Uma2 family endonuclease [Pirellulaceae bacterium]